MAHHPMPLLRDLPFSYPLLTQEIFHPSLLYAILIKICPLPLKVRWVEDTDSAWEGCFFQMYAELNELNIAPDD